ncbi:unnamed protein product [Sphagnum jensenii]|uniref:Uncharacterized protein n=1 Tax=Sphagnum jensenii TaxID=128206 RepID=A0ABP0V9Z7_9BRYO
MAKKKDSGKGPKRVKGSTKAVATAPKAKPKDVATTTPVQARAIVIIPEGMPDMTEITPITLSNADGFHKMLSTLGHKTCTVTLLMRGKVHEMNRKYHPDTGDPNPYMDKVVKYSVRSAFVNLPSEEQLEKWLEKNGQDQRALQKHPFAYVDETCWCVRRHRETDVPYLAISPNEKFVYREKLVNIDTGEEVTREEIAPYCNPKPDSWFKAPKLSNIIELRGHYWYGRFGNRKQKKFRFRNMDNISTMEIAIADALPLIPEDPDELTWNVDIEG